jgi:hypothetical protein
MTPDQHETFARWAFTAFCVVAVAFWLVWPWVS